MKPITSSTRFLKSLTALTIAASALASTALATVSGLPLFYSTGIDIGAAGFRDASTGQVRQWAVYALSSGVTATATTASLGTPTIYGDVGMNGGNLSISGNAYVYGHAYIRLGGTLVRSGLAKLDATNAVSPTQFPFSPTSPYTNRGINLATTIDPQNAANDTMLNQAYNDALAASAAAAALPNYIGGGVTSDFSLSSGVINSSTNINLFATGTKVVLNLSDFILTAGASLTIHGDQYTNLVINVSNTFSLVGGKILLDNVLGGNVLFNITGAGSAVTLTSGAKVGDPATAGGQDAAVILAPGRQVNISGSTVLHGTLIAKGVNISGNSRVVKPNWVSP